MKVLIIGGFLGSGKTTVIGKILTGMAANNTSAALIENEIGEVGIDDVFFGGNGISVTPLFGGCVCCQISGSLLDAAGKIQDEINPDWLIVEMTGLALMNNIRDVFLKYGRGGVSVHMISVLDISRWEILNKTVPQLIRHQLEGANVILMNKTDVSAITKEITASIKSINPQAESLAVSAIIENTGFWQRLEGLLHHMGGQNNDKQPSSKCDAPT